MAAEGASWGGEDVGAPQGDQVQHSEEQVDNFAQDSLVSGDAADNGTEDGGEYDPESVTIGTPVQVPEKAASATAQRQPSKPKMSGGFIVEASDDDEDEEPASDAPKVESVPPQNQPEPSTASHQTNIPAPAAVPSPAASSNVTPAFGGLDPVALLEARVKQDPRGDMDAWLNLIADHRRSSRLDQARTTYNRFLEIFPQAADIWVEWIEMELGLDNFVDAEQLFGRCLMTVPNVKLWTVYLNYIRRRNDLNNDASGQARRTITQSYEFVIDNIGVDRDSGNIWQDYVQFVKNGPGQIGGTGWQDQQKMDQLRKVYQRAISVPMLTVNNLWKEYDQFEMGLNKMTGRKFIQERSPGYMSAKSANIALDNITRHLKRTNLPRLPPAPGFDGDQEFRDQIEMWKKWIAWEKEDPLVLKVDEPKVFNQRVLYCYKQALMATRFWPEIWVDAAEWCFQNNVRENDKEMGTELLLEGIRANPESVLLALKHADHIEANYPAKEGDKSEYAKAVRKPYDDVLETLYEMGDKVKEREKMEVTALKQAAAQDPVQASIEQNDADDDDDDKPKRSPMEERILAIQKSYSSETLLLSRTISYVWIALARAMRRIQGKGNQSEGGLRKVFTDARQKGRLTSDVYVAVALLESVVYKDPVGAKIFERGARLFPNDEMFMIEYLKYLHSKDDTTNARVVFETCVNRLISKPETLAKAKPLYAYFHKYESQYGELSQISKLEDRMAELFPEDPKLNYFVSRFSSDKFDPISTPLIISKAVQMRPKQAVPVVEQPISLRNSPLPARQEQSPRPQYVRATASPKRPLGIDDEELNPPKRLARGVSPLKGAAGRRLDQQRRNQASALHRDITFLLNILPPAQSFDMQRLNPTALVNILRDTSLPDAATLKATGGGQQRYNNPSHARQSSGEYGNRPLSPYGRVSSAAGGYRNSPLRPESGGGYQANPYPPPEAGGASSAWQQAPSGYGAPPPGQYGYRY
ncbi:MRNA 3'-end-processing protein RNA14 [Fusarium keratoplasticum]|uniref:mRNA 3'-end-processing protein RNA14 n=1 Tax=Fusarium keratoplasticum TaxID=1328300 RepID=A0ACC0RFY1_9HYPO|nr:MRNA 3'-end-processing protein RNA14 [Fusarium keratoplasticum]KAI8684487.1 MRNA 3'-end-processing protein RNA14 [Fusarium keratoplasticum]KAI8688599.1 MRNA 3'-end-processing protein RNA14 [Fusarium keratoplasticum]